MLTALEDGLGSGPMSPVNIRGMGTLGGECGNDVLNSDIRCWAPVSPDITPQLEGPRFLLRGSLAG